MSQPTDFNDLARLHGPDVVNEQIRGVIDQAMRQAQAPDDPPLPPGTELALAEELIEAADGTLRWSPGMEWLRDRGTHWERDALLTRYTLAKAVCASHAVGCESPREAAKVCSASTVAAIISLARSDPRVATAVDRWDSEPMVLNTLSEAFDLETGHPVPRKGLLFTQLTRVAPQDVPTPLWSKFLQEVFAGDGAMVEFVQRLAGYCLTGSTREQKLFFMHGAGANGKSVLLDILRTIAGSYAHNLPVEGLLSSRNGSGHPTMFASLAGKRLAITGELPDSAHWDEARLKALTGDETMSARFMRMDFFEFRLSHKHVIAGNFKPRLKGDDFAMARRMVLIPFAQRFEGPRRDDKLGQKLRAELPGILAWAIAGAVKWARDGLAIPESVTKASEQYLAEQNDLGLWLQDRCDLDPAASTGAAALYQSYRGWKLAGGEFAESNRSFSQRLSRMFEKRRNREGYVYQGIALKAGPDLLDQGVEHV